MIGFRLPGWAWASIAGAALIVLLGLGGWGLHRSGYNQGRADERQAALIAQQAAQAAMQQEKDLADAKYRGAVLARQSSEARLAAATGRIGGLLQQLRDRSKVAPAGSRLDGAGPDWIGIFGECVSRLEQVGRDAARFADQVNGLQGYVRAVRKAD